MINRYDLNDLLTPLATQNGLSDDQLNELTHTVADFIAKNSALASLPTKPGSIITGATENYEGNVFERTWDNEGHWILTGEDKLFTPEELVAELREGTFVVLRDGVEFEDS